MSLAYRTTDLPLFAQRPNEPAFVTAPSTPLEARYARFYRNNPELFASLGRLALKQYREGASRLSIADMVEDLRKEARTKGESYAWNNSYRSFAARHLMYKHLELDGLFEIRTQTNARRKEGVS
jgi:hypothetical protein